MADQYRRALLAFPDEDVLLGTRLLGADGFRAFAKLTDVRAPPRPPPERRGAGLGPSAGQALRGREPPGRPHLRDQGHRLAWWAGSTSSRPKVRAAPELETLFEPMNVGRGDRLVAFGWAMAEDLAAGRLGR